MASLQKSLLVGASGQVGHQLVLTLGQDKVILAGRTSKPGWAHIDLAELSNSPEAAKRILGEENVGAVY
jgi:dTDP-4-dehydrorhamnose reductase